MPAAHLTPNAATLLLTLGISLIYFELNRPGSILPGALGLLATLFALAALSRYPLQPAAVLLCVSSIALYAVSLRRPVPLALELAATLALILGLTFLLNGSSSLRIHPLIAIVCGLTLGAGTSLLTRVARRARANKAVD